MSKIHSITAHEILDSRGNPTIETEIQLVSGIKSRASVPSGASTGSLEVVELRDSDPHRYHGKGVLKAVEHIHTTINSHLVGKEVSEQSFLDGLMIQLDGSPNKANLGGNTILSVSLAIAKAAALVRQQTLYQYFSDLLSYKPDEKFVMPVPMMNILNGGAHADNNIDIQEFMILPIGFDSFKEALRSGVEIFHTLKGYLKQKGLNTNVGDEGGFAPDLSSNEKAIEYLLEATIRAGYTPGKDIYIGLDVASNELYKNNNYYLEGKPLHRETWVNYWEYLVHTYPIISIEDGMAEADYDGWLQLTQRLGRRVQLVGDDLFVTNKKLLQKGIDQQWANALLVKPNQIGTLTETLEAIIGAKNGNYASIISHRSGETEDTTIADLAVGTRVGQIKTGAPCRTDRVAKYNRLLQIESELQNNVFYAGSHAFSRFLVD
ncbi:phosphopyruvate hydratase [Cardinium endosymbiont of Culicoides punctatus]|uniref:phosphopyruvate hydratase n=1 Tax=Cardinium endosymbiont of Culicoides punctatus TaxID=2304601 RepID=UPI001058FBBC|nr:phosphopyruvate hydratase [Cardinium endosymbiont of Culicoides punctatus]TDG94727.1 Enolase [Cardinium endosymbiont of Culicoides punctatus]